MYPWLVEDIHSSWQAVHRPCQGLRKNASPTFCRTISGSMFWKADSDYKSSASWGSSLHAWRSFFRSHSCCFLFQKACVTATARLVPWAKMATVTVATFVQCCVAHLSIHTRQLDSLKWFAKCLDTNSGGFESGLLLWLFATDWTPYPPRNPPFLDRPFH